MSAGNLNVLLTIKRHDMNTDGMNGAPALESSITWFGKMLTPEFLHD